MEHLLGPGLSNFTSSFHHSRGALTKFTSLSTLRSLLLKTWLPDKVYQFIYIEKSVAKAWRTEKVYQFIHTEKSVAKTWHTDKVYQFIHTEKPVAKTWRTDKVYQFIYIEKSVASHKSLQLKSGVLRNFVCLFCFCFVFICPFHIVCYSKMPQ